MIHCFSYCSLYRALLENHCYSGQPSGSLGMGLLAGLACQGVEGPKAKAVALLEDQCSSGQPSGTLGIGLAWLARDLKDLRLTSWAALED